LSALQTSVGTLAARMDAVEANTGLLDSLVVSPPMPPPPPPAPPFPSFSFAFSNQLVKSAMWTEACWTLSYTGDGPLGNTRAMVMLAQCTGAKNQLFSFTGQAFYHTYTSSQIDVRGGNKVARVTGTAAGSINFIALCDGCWAHAFYPVYSELHFLDHDGSDTGLCISAPNGLLSQVWLDNCELGVRSMMWTSVPSPPPTPPPSSSGL